MPNDKDQLFLEIGAIAGVFGVKGWVKVKSFTSPEENILTYSPWILKKGANSSQIKVEQGKLHGKGLVVKLEGVDNRDSALLMVGKVIYIDRERLPPAGNNEYYWADLIDLEVKNVDGAELGHVSHMLETGANDVLVTKGEKEHLIPFVQGDFIKEIDLNGRLIVVDWDPEF